jgi:acyl-coenzyme A thioesterase PaaI-like protein
MTGNVMGQSIESVVGKVRKQPLANLRTQLHPHCVVCSPDNPSGLCLHFAAGADDTVVAEFELDRAVEGYVGWPHGGITSAVLDGAMTNWLFAHNITGVTAELRVRFRHPVVLDEPAVVTARLKNALHPLYELEACIIQGGQLKVRATGRFMHKEYDQEERVDSE